MLALCVGVVGVACKAAEEPLCGGVVCPSQSSCDTIHDVCVRSWQRTACATLTNGAVCRGPDFADGYKCDQGICLRTIECGNNIIEAETAEVCDDGEANSDRNPDACRTNCLPARCGDGVVDTGEICDHGAANSDSAANACRSDCAPARCGDDVIDTGETCDGTALAGETCATQGLTSGTLACTNTCAFDTSGCN